MALSLSLALYLRNSQDLIQGNHVPGDFKVYFQAAQRVISGVDPYVISDGSPYKYSLGAVTPFLLLPNDEAGAWRVFKFLCVALWFVAIALGAAIATWTELGVLCLGIIISWKGLIETLDYGQIEFFLFFAVVLGARKKQTPFWAGFILGLLPAFKLPWAGILFPFLVISAKSSRDQFLKCCTGFIFGFLLFGGIVPLLLFGFQHSLEWSRSWMRLLAAQPREIYFGDMNQSLWSSFHRWYEVNPFWGTVMSAAVGLSFVSAITRIYRRLSVESRPEPLAFSAPWLVALQLVNPLGWRWGSCLLVEVPLYSMTVKSQNLRFVWGLLVFFVIVLFLVQQNFVAHFLGFGHWTELNRYGSVTLFWVGLLGVCAL